MMKRILLLAWSILMGLFSFSANATLELGQDAPAFKLIDQNNKTHTLEDYSEEWLIVYFYPKNDTPGCTKEACNFRDDFYQIRELGAQVVGVSVDDQASHEKFAEKYSLPFPLLADVDKEMTKAYGALWKMGPISLAKRYSFIINPEGKIAKIYTKVDPKTHSDEVIADIKQLQKNN